MTGLLIKDMSENDLLNTVLDYAKTGGWLRTHFRPAQTRSGKFVTALSGEKGFPDLVLVHAELQRCVFAELKTERGTTSPEQKRWLATLEAAGMETYLWRPRDLDFIRESLLGHRLTRPQHWG